jgi:TetR/AcrR family transcriptional repressor of nem operon
VERGKPRTDTRERLLEVAGDLVQQRGYNAVSYRDLAGAVEIKTASIHYYFPAKADLVQELVRRYRAGFDAARQEIDRRRGRAADDLAAYCAVLVEGFRVTGRMCLGGMLAAESSSLPEAVNAEVRRFFAENEAWLAGVLTRGSADGTLRRAGDPEAAARSLFAALEGALMAAWTFGDERRLEEAGRWLLSSLQA